MIGNRVGAGKAIFDYGAITTIDINSQKVFDGVAFSVAKRVTYPQDNTPVYILFDPRLTTSDSVVLLPMIFNAYGSGPIHIDIFANPTVTAETGDNIPCFNRENNISEGCKSVITLNPTITDTGTKLAPEFIVMSNGTPAVANIGGEAVDSFVTVLNKSTVYLIRASNQSTTDDALGWFGFNFFEANKV